MQEEQLLLMNDNEESVQQFADGKNCSVRHSMQDKPAHTLLSFDSREFAQSEHLDPHSGGSGSEHGLGVVADVSLN